MTSTKNCDHRWQDLGDFVIACTRCGMPETEWRMTYVPRPCELDDDPAELHIVMVDQMRIECIPECSGPEPHMAEYRALDVNPNR